MEDKKVLIELDREDYLHIKMQDVTLVDLATMLYHIASDNQTFKTALMVAEKMLTYENN